MPHFTNTFVTLLFDSLTVFSTWSCLRGCVHISFYLSFLPNFSSITLNSISGIFVNSPMYNEARSSTAFLLKDKVIATEQKLPVEFCVSFEFMVKYMPDVKTVKDLLRATSHQNEEIFHFRFTDHHELMIHVQDSNQVIKKVVEKNVFSSLTLGKAIILNVCRGQTRTLWS